MHRKNFLGVFGHVAIDIIGTVKRFPESNTCEALTDCRRVYGGTGANLAAFATSLGVKTSLASFVGGDFPTDFREFLDNLGVDLTDLVTIERGRTPTVIMITDSDHNQIGFVDQGIMLEQEELPLLEHSIADSEFVHVGTGRPGYAYRVCKKAKELGKRIGFDPAQEIHYVYRPEDLSRVLPLVEIFFCNEAELHVSLKYLGLSQPSELLRFVETLVVTLGKDGSRIMTRKGETIEVAPCRPAALVDPTGAGDAYRAGFYAGLSRALSLEDCGRAASASASFAVEDFGGQSKPTSWEAVSMRAFGDMR